MLNVLPACDLIAQGEALEYYQYSLNAHVHEWVEYRDAIQKRLQPTIYIQAHRVVSPTLRENIPPSKYRVYALGVMGLWANNGRSMGLID